MYHRNSNEKPCSCSAQNASGGISILPLLTKKCVCSLFRGPSSSSTKLRLQAQTHSFMTRRTKERKGIKDRDNASHPTPSSQPANPTQTTSQPPFSPSSSLEILLSSAHASRSRAVRAKSTITLWRVDALQAFLLHDLPHGGLDLRVSRSQRRDA